MRKSYLRIISALTSIALLGGTAGLASLANVAAASEGGPTVTLTSSTGSTTSAGSVIPFTATFSQPVTGFTQSDIMLGGTASSSVSDFTSVSSTTYTFNVNVSTQGTLTVEIAPDAGTLATTTGSQPSNTLSYTVVSASSTATSTPVISNVSVSDLGTSTATINWTTDVPATGTVWFGTTTSYGSHVQSTTTASTSQSVTLDNLNPGTLYHFTITAAGASSTGTTTDRVFTTQSTSTGTSTPLAVTGIDAVDTTAVANNSFSDGWEWVMHLTVPDNEDAFRIKFSDWTMGNTSFPANGNIKVYSTQSSNASTTDSAITETGNGFSDWLYLNGDTSSTTPGRQIDLHILVKIPVGTAAGSYTTAFTAQSWPQSATSTATS